MNPKDYRIGNLVSAKSPERTKWMKNHPLNTYDLASIINGSLGIRIDLKPIKLHGGVLEGFGFIIKSHKTIALRRAFLILDGELKIVLNVNAVGLWYFSWACVFLQDSCFPPTKSKIVALRYVHELQNLYYTLTKQELNLK